MYSRAGLSIAVVRICAKITLVGELLWGHGRYCGVGESKSHGTIIVEREYEAAHSDRHHVCTRGPEPNTKTLTFFINQRSEDFTQWIPTNREVVKGGWPFYWS